MYVYKIYNIQFTVYYARIYAIYMHNSMYINSVWITCNLNRDFKQRSVYMHRMILLAYWLLCFFMLFSLDLMWFSLQWSIFLLCLSALCSGASWTSTQEGSIWPFRTTRMKLLSVRHTTSVSSGGTTSCTQVKPVAGHGSPLSSWLH